VLHVSDILGTLIHFAFVVRFLIPRPPAADFVTPARGTPPRERPLASYT
jgi:hypothetical protein